MGEERRKTLKKQYLKPVILFEDFTMSTSISAGCDKMVGAPTRDSCGVLFGDGFVFIEGITGCVIKPVDGSDEYNGFCLHVPYDEHVLFNS